MADPFQRIPLDDRVADHGLLRFVAAGATLIGCIWLATTRPPALAWVAVAGGLFFAWFWFRRWARSQRLVSHEQESYLALEPHGFTVALGDQVQTIEWHQVGDIEADEERVAIRVELASDAAPMYVEPLFGGLGLYDLEAAFTAARDASASASNNERAESVSEANPARS